MREREEVSRESLYERARDERERDRDWQERQSKGKRRKGRNGVYLAPARRDVFIREKKTQKAWECRVDSIYYWP